MWIVVLCTVALGQLALGQEPLVTTSQGTMKGKILKSRDGRDFFSFTKIPYAKPPVGPRRFMIPEKADNWTGVLDATERIPACARISYSGTEFSGQEDCLYLNVFTPNITGRLPVIFSIHGGAFRFGSANDFGSARFYMDEDVVFVAPNYRLGTLGFLSFEDDIIPGNMGLKDQALALEWVHREISAFGGDPNLITVIGESAGGASSDLICAVPRTNGLIKGCISQSGNGWTHWAILKPGEARKMALSFVKAIGCEESGLLKCLQEKPQEMIANITLLLGDRVISLTSPVLEPVTAPEPILTKWHEFANHNYPWIVGVCQDDGMVITLQYEFNLKNQEETLKFIDSFNQTVTFELGLENRTNDLIRIRERFFKNGVEPLIGFRDFATEYMFEYPSLKGLSRHSGPTYYFKFNYTKGPPAPYGSNNRSGVRHGAELPFFFESDSNPTNWPQPEDVALSKMLVKMWVNFARNQSPSSQDTMEWTQFQGKYYLDIQDSGVKISSLDQYQEILDFWKPIDPDHSSSSSKSNASFSLIAVLSIFTALLCNISNT